MTLLPAIAAAPPPPVADCDPLAALDTEEKRHLFGVGVLHMAATLTAAKARIAELEAEIAELRSGPQASADVEDLHACGLDCLRPTAAPASRRGSWTWRRELLSAVGFAAALLGALLLAGFDRAWWLRSLVADALAPFGWVVAGIAVLLASAREYPSAVLAAVVAAASWLGWFVLRVPERGGAR